MWITVNYFGDPDNGVIVAGYVGSLMLAGSYLAVSCMTSALTRNQVISFILSVMICLFLILAGYTPVTDLLSRFVSPVVEITFSVFFVILLLLCQVFGQASAYHIRYLGVHWFA